MPTTHFLTHDTQALLTGLSGDDVRKIKWATVAEARGITRMMLLTDLDYRDVRAEVRLNPDVLAARGDRYKSPLRVHVNDNIGSVDLTTDWVSMRASAAAWLQFRSLQDANMGGDYNEDVAVPDGLGNLIWNSYTRRGARDLLQFRLPADTFVFVTS